MDELRTWDAVATAAAIAAGDVSGEEVVDAAIARAEAAHAADPSLGALVTTTYDTARLAARRPAPGPLSGVPTAVKDLDDLAGVVTGMGSVALGGVVPTRTSPSVRQLLSPGLVPIGKSAAPELGLTASTEPLHALPTRNPWHADHTPGGSSGGSAALVASGVVPLAHATDGGGSIRIPAAMCGLVGLKPSYGRFAELEDMQGLPVKLAVPGVVTTTVRDTAAWFAAAEAGGPCPAGLPPVGHVTTPQETPVRVGMVLEDPTGSLLDRDVVAAVERTAAALEDAGHHVRPVTVPYDDDFADAFLLYWALLAQGASLLGVQRKGRDFRSSQLDPWTRWLAAYARRNAARMPGAIRTLKRAPALAAAQFEDLDVLLSPVLSSGVPPLGHLAPDVAGEEHLARVRSLMPWTPPANVAGTPAVSLPLGRVGGLPVGVQLGAAVGQEALLLRLSLQLEQALPWQRHAPGWW